MRSSRAQLPRIDRRRQAGITTFARREPHTRHNRFCAAPANSRTQEGDTQPQLILRALREQPHTRKLQARLITRARLQRVAAKHSCAPPARSRTEEDYTTPCRNNRAARNCGQSPATRNRTRDHLIAASFYSQMLYQLSYSRLVCAVAAPRPDPRITQAQRPLAQPTSSRG